MDLIPRLYQLEVVELAKQSNVVAYLDTGAGKTFIAVLLLRHRLEAATAARAAAAAAGAPPPPPWKAVFLAPQVALVEQHAAVLQRSLDARVEKIVGADIVAWSGDTYVTNWRAALDNLDILVATPQILVDLLSRGIVPGVGVFDVVVLDEAHHAKGGHPYARIMEFYRREKAAGNGARLPRIFGASAAPAGAGAARLSALAKGLRELEAALDARVVTCADRSGVEAAVPQPDLMIERFVPGTTAPDAHPALGALQSSIERAAARLNLAVSMAELRWKAGLEGAFNSSTAGAAQYTSFEPGAPRFKVSRLKDVLRSVLHVLHQVGAYGAAQSTLDALRWCAAGAPDPRADSYSGFYGNGGGAGRDSFDSLGFGAVNPATERSLAIEALQVRAAIEGFSMQEISHLGAAAAQSTVEVVEAFSAAFRGAAPAAALTALRAAAAAGQPLRRAPIEIMEAILASISTDDLTASLAFLSSAGTAAHLRYGFPLLSATTVTLVTVLQRYKDRSTSQFQWSGIVFAQQRLTALALAAVLSALPATASWLRISPLMAQGSAFGGMDFSPEDQRAILDKFRAGTLNLIVATSVAEEGIDVRTCQLVVRFDPATNVQSFHQSRGRARAAGSHLVVLVTAGDTAEEAAVARMAAYQAQMRAAALQNVAGLAEGPWRFFHEQMLDCCHPLEKVRAEGITLEQAACLARCNGAAVDVFPYGSQSLEEFRAMVAAAATTADHHVVVSYSRRAFLQTEADYVIPSTSARVGARTASNVLQLYVAQLPADEYILLRPAWRLEFFGDAAAQRVRATVRLPSSSPVHLMEGPLAPTKHAAKAAVALEAVIQLHRLGALNDHLMPTALGGGEEDAELDEAVEEAVEEQGQKRKRPGRRLSMIELVRTPPAGLAMPLPLLQDVSESVTVTMYGYGWKKAGDGEWMALVVLLPGTIEATAQGGGTGSGSGADWGDATPLGEFVMNKEQLALVLRCSKALCGVARCSGSGAPTFALAPLHLERSAAPQYLNWDTMRKVVWLQMPL